MRESNYNYVLIDKAILESKLNFHAVDALSAYFSME
jgi:hypothetical protein